MRPRTEGRLPCGRKRFPVVKSILIVMLLVTGACAGDGAAAVDDPNLSTPLAGGLNQRLPTPRTEPLSTRPTAQTLLPTPTAEPLAARPTAQSLLPTPTADLSPPSQVAGPDLPDPTPGLSEADLQSGLPNIQLPAAWEIRQGLMAREEGAGGDNVARLFFVHHVTAPQLEYVVTLSGTPRHGLALSNLRTAVVERLLEMPEITVTGHGVDGTLRKDGQVVIYLTYAGENPAEGAPSGRYAAAQYIMVDALVGTSVDTLADSDLDRLLILTVAGPHTEVDGVESLAQMIISAPDLNRIRISAD